MDYRNINEVIETIYNDLEDKRQINIKANQMIVFMKKNFLGKKTTQYKKISDCLKQFKEQGLYLIYEKYKYKTYTTSLIIKYKNEYREIYFKDIFEEEDFKLYGIIETTKEELEKEFIEHFRLIEEINSKYKEKIKSLYKYNSFFDRQRFLKINYPFFCE